MPASFARQGAEAPQQREQSPEPPPYSPITPVEGRAPQFPSLRSNEPDFMDTAPASEPINETTNSDAIALRAALGILQIQRQRALQDMQTLEQQKDKALDDPKAFSDAIMSGDIRSHSSRQKTGRRASLNEDEAEDSDEAERDIVSGFGDIPSAQNVARCPPINWAKYHVVGEVLDKLHKEQQSRPDMGQPLSDRPPVHQVTAPYNPWKDKLPDKSTRTRTDANRKAPS